MKIRSGSVSVEDLLPDASPGKLEVKNSPAEIRRVITRLRTLLAPHFEGAGRMDVTLGPDDLRAVIDALLAEADGLNPDPHLQCPEELRHYLRRTMFDDLVGEPSNVLYTTQVNDEVVRYEAMPVESWKDCLRALGNLNEAKGHLALAQPETKPDVAYYLSLVHEALGDFDAAQDAVQLALVKQPQDADYLNQASCIACSLGCFDEALEKSEQAWNAEPQSAGFAFNHAQNLLLAGRSLEAWPLFEARLAFTPDHLFPENGSAAWEGQPLEGKSLLVWHEQGLGDSIQFSQYLPLLVAIANRVVFRCQPELVTLLAPRLKGIQIVPPQVELPKTDFHVPLLSVPGRLGCDLSAPPTRVFSPLPASTRISRIGFACAGNSDHPDDAGRSLPLSAFVPLLDSRFEWICLQKDLRQGELLPSHVAHPGAGYLSFVDTAQEISSVDLVISADTAVAHLAASLGKPTWILLPLCPDWRWGRHGERTAWYPSARLFRQIQPGNWSSVMGQIQKELQIL